jgi:RNA polymerase sigma-70 factor, ECF subfamily
MRDLYRRHGRVVYGVALAICGDASTAEEVAQDVFVRVWKNAHRYQADKARVVTWLARVARNAAIDALRSATSRAGHSEIADDLLDRLVDPHGVDPGDSAQTAHRRERVRAEVAKLPSEQRHALFLAFFQGLTHREISERLGEPLGTVKTRIRDALGALRGQLGEEWP